MSRTIPLVVTNPLQHFGVDYDWIRQTYCSGCGETWAVLGKRGELLKETVSPCCRKRLRILRRDNEGERARLHNNLDALGEGR